MSIFKEREDYYDYYFAPPPKKYKTTEDVDQNVIYDSTLL